MNRIPTNNPVTALMTAMQRGADPRALISQMAQQTPQAQIVMQMMQGKSGRDLEQLVRNVAKTRGVDLEGMARSMGLQIPGGR